MLVAPTIHFVWGEIILQIISISKIISPHTNCMGATYIYKCRLLAEDEGAKFLPIVYVQGVSAIMKLFFLPFYYYFLFGVIGVAGTTWTGPTRLRFLTSQVLGIHP